MENKKSNSVKKDKNLCDDYEACVKAAEFVTVIGHPLRIAIVCYLTTGEKSVSDIARKVGKPHAQASLALSKLYTSGWVTKRREGNSVFYSLKDVKLKELLENIKNKFI